MKLSSLSTNAVKKTAPSSKFVGLSMEALEGVRGGGTIYLASATYDVGYAVAYRR